MNNKLKFSLLVSTMLMLGTAFANPLVSNKVINTTFNLAKNGSSSFTIKNFSITSFNGYQDVLTNVPQSGVTVGSTPYSNGNIELVEPLGKASFQGSVTVSYQASIGTATTTTFTHTIEIGPNGDIINQSDTLEKASNGIICEFNTKYATPKINIQCSN